MAQRTHPPASRGRTGAAETRRGRRDRRTRAARAEHLDTRAALLDATAEVVARRGLRDATVDEIAEVAGCSKGAVYWHFESKDDLLFALFEDRLDRPTREMIELLESAPPEQDMAPEGSRRFEEMLRAERDLLMLETEYWGRAMRDGAVRARYVDRQARMRAAIGRALVTRLDHLGTPVDPALGDVFATAIMALGAGLARERLIDPDAVPDDLLGRVIVLIYKGLLADAAGS